MDYRRRRFALGFAVLALVAATSHRPSFDVTIDTDAPSVAVPGPQAVVKLGLTGVSILVTWGAEQLR